MPGFPWLSENVLDEKQTPKKLKAMKILGVPYTDADIAGASDAVKGKTEMDALIAYLQVLGTSIKSGGD
jgi:cytochrome c oxidase cbb3-type subunit 2